MSVVMFWLKMDFKNTLNSIVIDLFKITVEYTALKTNIHNKISIFSTEI